MGFVVTVLSLFCVCFCLAALNLRTGWENGDRLSERSCTEYYERMKTSRYTFQQTDAKALGVEEEEKKTKKESKAG